MPNFPDSHYNLACVLLLDPENPEHLKQAKTDSRKPSPSIPISLAPISCCKIYDRAGEKKRRKTCLPDRCAAPENRPLGSCKIALFYNRPFISLVFRRPISVSIFGLNRSRNIGVYMQKLALVLFASVLCHPRHRQHRHTGRSIQRRRARRRRHRMLRLLPARLGLLWIPVLLLRGAAAGCLYASPAYAPPPVASYAPPPGYAPYPQGAIPADPGLRRLSPMIEARPAANTRAARMWPEPSSRLTARPVCSRTAAGASIQ